jgi:hypothetical protein
MRNLYNILTGVFKVKNPSIKELLALTLRANGYSGLVNLNIECGCEIDDLCPCGELNPEHCFAGYKTMCTNLCTHDTQYGIINNNNDAWHIQLTKEAK